METKYTQGPWTFSQESVCDGNGDKVASLIESPSLYLRPRGENLANARLIACAPELLEALQAFVDYLDSDLSEAEAILKQRAETLITKATQP